jgi:multicomponent Na+:H+ antiporter subunit G
MIDTIGGIAMIVGAGLVALAGLGSLRFHDVFDRMHSATKASTLGILLIAIGSAVRLGDWAAALKIFVAVSLIFITAPIAAHLVGRAAYPDWKRTQPADRPDDLAGRADPRG